MAWPTPAPIDATSADIGHTRRKYTQGAGASLVTTIDTYDAGYADGQAQGAAGAVVVTGQLWPR